MNSNSMPGGNVIHEITPLSERDCFYVVDRYKKEFDYPMHCHSEYELNFVEHASGVRRVVGDNAEIIGEYDLVLITGRELEHVWNRRIAIPRIYMRSPSSLPRTPLDKTFSTRRSLRPSNE